MKLPAFLLSLILAISSGHCFSQVITTVAGNGSASYSGDGGLATLAALRTPHGITIDGSGELYICDVNNNRIRKVTAAGIISTIAGTGVAGDSPDGALATATKVNQPFDVVVDASGNIYYCDQNNYKVKKIGTTGIVTTIAGTGVAGFSGDGGPATNARLNKPTGLVFNAAGDLVIADQYNHRIRQISPSGTISTIAGTGTIAFGGDGGPATAAYLSFPNFLSLDNSGNILITDNGNHRIRKLTPSGTITTVVGNGVSAFTGDGGPATNASIFYPGEALMDASGNIYVSDNVNNRIRFVNTAGVISTFSGTGSATFCGDGGVPSTACVNGPVDIAIDPSGSLYISDLGNNRVRKLVIPSNSTPYFINGASQSLTVCQDAAAAAISSLLSVVDSNTGQTLTWALLVPPTHGTASVAYTTTSTGTTVTPTGLTYTPATGYSGTDVFSVTISDGFASDTITINVTINPLPAATISSSITTLCVGTTAVFSGAPTGGTWMSGNPAVATVSTSGTVGGASLGTAIISYTVSNACGSATDTQTINVTNTASAGTISGPTNVCAGATISLTDPVPGGSWSSGNPAVATVSASGTVGGVSPGTATISYTVTNLCGTATTTYTITVDPLPATPTITGSRRVCVGSAITLSATPAGGAWSSSAPSVANVTGGVVSGFTAGMAIISYTLTNACGSASDTQLVSVFPLPPAGTLTGPTLLCTGGSASITSSVTGGSWVSTNPSVATIDPSTGTIYPASAGSTIITYTVGPDDNGCSATAAFTLNIGAASSLVVNSVISNPPCSGQANGAITLSVPTGSGSYQYAWSTGSAMAGISGLGAGPYSVTVTDLVSACSDTLIFNIIAPSPIDVSYTVINDKCDDSAGSISLINFGGGTAPYTYLWSNGSTSANVTALATGLYHLTVTDANACTATFNITVGEDSCTNIIIHDVITPNGDGINDEWVIEGIGAYPNTTVQLFDKWGDIVFSAKDYTNNWRGGTLPDGTYIYLIKLGNGASSNGKNSFTGTFLIKR